MVIKRSYLFTILILSSVTDIFIATYGFYSKYAEIPNFFLAILMLPMSKPISFGGSINILDPFSHSSSWVVLTLLYWPLVLGLIIYSLNKKILWPMLMVVAIGVIGSPQCFIIGIGLFGI